MTSCRRLTIPITLAYRERQSAEMWRNFHQPVGSTHQIQQTHIKDDLYDTTVVLVYTEYSCTTRKRYEAPENAKMLPTCKHVHHANISKGGIAGKSSISKII